MPPRSPGTTQRYHQEDAPTISDADYDTQGDTTVFDFGPWRSAVASRRNDDGTTSFISIDPTVDGFNFVVGPKDGKRALTVRTVSTNMYLSRRCRTNAWELPE